uniref:P-type domain-containing protein n=1 Tax=Panagrolaimus superbus TaxID=310955 RepID=A0A914YN06_9BILA
MFWLSLILLISVIFGDNSVDQKYRINCQPGRDKDPNNCKNQGCFFDATNNTVSPLCYFPAKTGYIALNLSNDKGTSDKQIILQKDPKSVKNPFGSDFSQLNFTWFELGSAAYIKITPISQDRYRPPIPLADSTPIISSEKFTVISSQDGIWSFNVIRNSTGAKIWDTSLGGLLFADQYIQISTIVPTDRVYGFGENIHPTLKHDFNHFRTYAMFARDQAPDSKDPLINNVGKNLYGQIEVFFFPGPTPEEVIKQYQQLIGTPMLPPYWALGFQLCRYGYSGIKEIQDVVDRMRAAGIPQDVQFSDIDYLNEYEDFSYNKNLSLILI